MKKRSVIVLLLLLMMFVFVACARKHVVKAANSMPSNASKVGCPKFK